LEEIQRKKAMKVHEYQAKNLLKEFGIPVPAGEVAETTEKSIEIGDNLGNVCVLKAQVHAGGRGKAGGIKLAKTKEDVKKFANELIGMKLVSKQTGTEGKIVKKILIEEIKEIEKELYLGIVIDRSSACPVIMASSAGGMEIEEVAAKTPELIIKEYINPMIGFKPFQARNIVTKLNLPKEVHKEAMSFIANLYNLFISKDCSLAEINPLVLTKDNHILALDAKLNFDDSALHRHKDIQALRDTDEEDPLEVEASKYSLNYIKLDGNVGCMVNGAGLAMATMDIIKLAGSSPANFLDVGGGATVEGIENAFNILLKDKNVRAVLINIFGGILRCDNLAKGVVEAAEKSQVNLPVIIRLEGTNVEEGKNILKNSNLKFSVADTMAEAATMVTQAVS
jgi:succinyl-CoA synthetase beta subunit